MEDESEKDIAKKIVKLFSEITNGESKYYNVLKSFKNPLKFNLPFPCKVTDEVEYSDSNCDESDCDCDEEKEKENGNEHDNINNKENEGGSNINTKKTTKIDDEINYLLGKSKNKNITLLKLFCLNLYFLR